MSAKKERFTKYMADVDNYITHQMGRKTEAGKLAFRNKQIAMYDDALEKYAENLKKALARQVRQ